jgi:hypothetical protein
LLTRRHLQIGLGVLWLLDAALQYQPYMFTAAFPHDDISGAAVGQPGWIVAGSHWAAHVMTAAPVVTNAGFATIQLLLAVGLFFRPTIRLALAGSMLWGVAVWFFGEALGGLASGHATIITGAPGAALLYAIVAALAWPSTQRGRCSGWTRSRLPATAMWAILWGGSAVLQLLPAQHDSAPRNTAFVMTLFLVALAPLTGTVGIRFAALTGATLAMAFWIFGQNFGELWTGSATDPNSGPLFILLALVLIERVSALQVDQASYSIDEHGDQQVRARSVAALIRQRAA